MYPLNKVLGASTAHCISAKLPSPEDKTYRPPLTLSIKTPEVTFSCSPQVTADEVAELLEPYVLRFLRNTDEKSTMVFPSCPSHEAVDAYHFAKLTPTRDVTSRSRVRSSSRRYQHKSAIVAPTVVNLRVTLLQVKHVTTPVPHTKAGIRYHDLKTSFKSRFHRTLHDPYSGRTFHVSLEVDYCYVVSGGLDSIYPFRCNNGSDCFAIRV